LRRSAKRAALLGSVVMACAAAVGAIAAFGDTGSSSSAAPGFINSGAVKSVENVDRAGEMTLAPPSATSRRYGSTANADRAFGNLLESDLYHQFDASQSGEAVAKFGDFTSRPYANTDTTTGALTPILVDVPAWVFVFKNASVSRHGGSGGTVPVTVEVVVDARTDSPLLMNADG
jgi:hypothetical protein